MIEKVLTWTIKHHEKELFHSEKYDSLFRKVRQYKTEKRWPALIPVAHIALRPRKALSGAIKIFLSGLGTPKRLHAQIDP